MKLGELFDKGEFVVTGEVGPVKGVIPRDENFVPSCVKEAKHLNGCVHAINVTDNQSAVMKLGSLAACVRLKKKRTRTDLPDHVPGPESDRPAVGAPDRFFTGGRQHAAAHR